MTDQIYEVTLEELLGRWFEHWKIPDQWLEQLVPGEEEGPLVWMTGKEGRPRWMANAPDNRDKLRAEVDAILVTVARAQEGTVVDLHRNLLPTRSPETIQNMDWSYVGATRSGDALELWHKAEARFGTTHHHMRLTYDVAVIRAPLTNATLKAAVLDRDAWLKMRNEPYEI